MNRVAHPTEAGNLLTSATVAHKHALVSAIPRSECTPPALRFIA